MIPEVTIEAQQGGAIRRKAGRPLNSADRKQRILKKPDAKKARKDGDLARLFNLNVQKGANTRRLAERRGGETALKQLQSIEKAAIRDDASKFMKDEFANLKRLLAGGAMKAPEVLQEARDLSRFAAANKRETQSQTRAAGAAQQRDLALASAELVGTDAATQRARFNQAAGSQRKGFLDLLKSTGNEARQQRADIQGELIKANTRGFAAGGPGGTPGRKGGSPGGPRLRSKAGKAPGKVGGGGLPEPKAKTHECLEHDVRNGCHRSMEKVEKNKRSRSKELAELERSRSMLTKTINYVRKA